MKGQINPKDIKPNIILMTNKKNKNILPKGEMKNQIKKYLKKVDNTPRQFINK